MNPQPTAPQAAVLSKLHYVSLLFRYQFSSSLLLSFLARKVLRFYINSKSEKMESYGISGEVIDASNWKKELVNATISTSELISRLILFQIKKAVDKKSPLVKLAMKIEEKKIEEKAAPYIASIMVILLAGKEVNRENMKLMIDSVGLKVDKRTLDFASSLDFSNSIIYYAPVLYFLLVLGKLSAENITKVLDSVGVISSIEVAKEVLSVYEESKERSLEKMDPESSDYKFISSAKDASAIMAIELSDELDRTFESKSIQEHVERGFIPYISALGVLAFMGKETDIRDPIVRKDISAIVSSIGIKPDQEMLDYLSSLNYVNAGFIYIPTIYFIAASGEEPTVQKMEAVIKALGAKFDENNAGFALISYKDFRKGRSIKKS